MEGKLRRLGESLFAFPKGGQNTLHRSWIVAGWAKTQKVQPNSTSMPPLWNGKSDQPFLRIMSMLNPTSIPSTPPWNRIKLWSNHAAVVYFFTSFCKSWLEKMTKEKKIQYNAWTLMNLLRSIGNYLLGILKIYPPFTIHKPRTRLYRTKKEDGGKSDKIRGDRFYDPNITVLN